MTRQHPQGQGVVGELVVGAGQDFDRVAQVDGSSQPQDDGEYEDNRQVAFCFDHSISNRGLNSIAGRRWIKFGRWVLAIKNDVLQERLMLLDEYISDLRELQGISFQEYQKNKLIRP